MCDSKSCLSDFTKYCPAEGLCDENLGVRSSRARSQSLKVKNQVAWFSKKPKPAFASRHQVTIRMLGENDRSEDQFAPYRGRSKSYVSQEELRALQGCVSRRRALFISNQESTQACHTIPQLKSSRKYQQAPTRNSLPSSDLNLCNSHQTLKRFDKVSLFERTQHSSAFDLAKAEDIHPPNQSGVPDTVSVQFRSESQECIATDSSQGSLHSGHVECCSSNTSCLLPGVNVNPQTHAKSSSIPGWLNSPRILHNCSHRSTCDVTCLSSSRECVQSSPHLVLPHDQSACNSWPRNQLTHTGSYHQDGLGKLHKIQPRHRSSEKSSPHHQRKEPSLLGEGTEVISSDLNLEIFGSTSSICSTHSHQSSVTNASVCSERPHFHYGKGIDGVEFKRKSDVSECIFV